MLCEILSLMGDILSEEGIDNCCPAFDGERLKSKSLPCIFISLAELKADSCFMTESSAGYDFEAGLCFSCLVPCTEDHCAVFGIADAVCAALLSSEDIFVKSFSFAPLKRDSSLNALRLDVFAAVCGSISV
jgi:hypothetical protein